MDKRRILNVFALLLICVFRLPGASEAVKISVLEPSILESVMEAGRDFYVIGRIDREGRSAAELPVDIRVEVAVTGLVRAGEKIPIRTVRSHVDRQTGVTPPRDIFCAYGEGSPWANASRGELLKSPPPDLVYRHGDPQSFYDPSVKAVVNENAFAALVQGGATKDFDTDYRRVYGEDLEWNLFRVFVEAMSGDEVLDSLEMDIMFGSVQEKMLASTDPPEHDASVRAFAGPRGIRVYRNRFPGCWDFGLERAYEIPLRHRPNLALEYLEGRVHAVIYNISENSLTQRVALGRIAFQGWLDTEEIYFYRYDIGEPCLTYEKWGETLCREGVITRFEEGNGLALTRAEIIGATVSESVCRPFENAGRTELYPFAAAIVRPGDTLRLYGVVTPIQPRLSEVVPEPDAAFTIQNRIDKICYVFEDMLDGVFHTEEHRVGLTRFYEAGPSVSIYEFRHTFTLPQSLRGRVVTVFASAYDSRGEKVRGAGASFYLYLRE